MLATQAEFARAADVSRKTITVWKSRGSLVLQGDMIDVEKTLAHLRHYKRHGSAIAEKVTAALARGVTSPVPTVTQAAAGVTSAPAVTSDDEYVPNRIWLANMAPGENREFCLGHHAGELAMAWYLIVDVPQIATEAAMRAGLPVEAAQAMFADMREEAYALMAYRLDESDVVHEDLSEDATWADHLAKADRGRFHEPDWSQPGSRGERSEV